MTKEHIISEIRRAAKANAGTPLGRDAFFRKTGIKPSDWEGKYWVRWNDAVREAGLKPNQYQVALNEDFLIAKYVELIRELGHIPVKAELRMKVRMDSTFPNDTTFAGRFGRK